MCGHAQKIGFRCSSFRHLPATRPKPCRGGCRRGYLARIRREWRYVSRLLVSLAEAIPADKYGWRPEPGVRSVSEVLMHIAQSNYGLLSVTGPKMPPELESNDVEERIVSKPEVVEYLRQSLEAVKTARAHLRPGDLQR